MANLIQAVHAQCIYDGINEYACLGNLGTATVVGTTGAEFFRFADGTTGDLILVSGGDDDTIVFSGSLTGVIIDMTQQSTFQTVYTGLNIWFQGFATAWISGSQAADVLTGTSNDDAIVGNGGDDIITTGAGDDYISDSSGTNTLNGGDGADRIYGGTGTDTIIGGSGDDEIFGNAGADNISGGDGSDDLFGGTEDDTISGGAGSDTIDGRPDADTTTDTASADCAGDSQTNVETNQCVIVSPPVVTLPQPAPHHDAQACSTRYIRLEISNRRTAVFYGTAADGTPGTLFIGELPVSMIRNITEAERISGLPIWIAGFDSTVVQGWRIDIYWQHEYYGVHIVGDGGTFVDDTGAACAL